MAMAEFLRNVQTARNIYFSQLAASDTTDPLPADRSPQDWNRLRTTAPLWLSPRVVAGFDEEEFGFLPAERRGLLTEAVSKFRTIADATSGREPTQDEMNRAIRYLIVIIGRLDENLLDEEGKALLVALTAAKKPFPDFVLGLDYTLDTDATGDPGIWIWVIVPDDVDPDSSDFRQFSTRFRKAVRNVLAEVKSERLPYIHFRLFSEALGAMREGVA